MRFTGRWFYRSQRGEVNPFYREEVRSKISTTWKEQKKLPTRREAIMFVMLHFCRTLRMRNRVRKEMEGGWGLRCVSPCRRFMRITLPSLSLRLFNYVIICLRICAFERILRFIWCGILNSSRSAVLGSWLNLGLCKGFQKTGPGWPLGQTSGCGFACLAEERRKRRCWSFKLVWKWRWVGSIYINMVFILYTWQGPVWPFYL